MYAHMLTFENGFLPRGITSPRISFLNLTTLIFEFSPSCVSSLVAWHDILRQFLLWNVHCRGAHAIHPPAARLSREWTCDEDNNCGFDSCGKIIYINCKFERCFSFSMRLEFAADIFYSLVVTICLIYSHYKLILGPRALGLFLHNLVDFLTLVVCVILSIAHWPETVWQMNTLGIHYSKRRFNALYGKGSLNARYQVCWCGREEYNIY